MCIFGQKELALYQWDKLVDTQFSNSTPYYIYDHFVDWIWDVCILEEKDCVSKLAVGTAHNTVVLWDITSNKAIKCYYGKERCILYSMSILNLHGELLIASGTVFTEVHVWPLLHPENTIVCKKHNGVIFKLRWSQDGRYLLSVSDDRSLIAWKNTISSSDWSVEESTTCDLLCQGTYNVAFRAIGHTARLWDCLFTPTCIITSSEDCTVRFWSSEGKCLATCGGHKGKHIWCIAYDPVNDVAITGGNDSSIKLWDVTSIVESYQNVSIRNYVIPTLVNVETKSVRNSKSECIRDISMSADGLSVFVASNWGYVWQFDISSEKWNTIYTPEIHSSVSTLAISKDNEIVVSGSYNGEIHIISLLSHFPALKLQPSSIRINRIEITKESDHHYLIFVIGANNQITILSLLPHEATVSTISSFTLTMKGMITSTLWLSSYHILCLGDSLGSIHCIHFQQTIEKEDFIMDLQSSFRCHNHVPICALAYHDHLLWTGDHDGKIVPISIDWTTLKCTAQTPISVPKITQIMTIWWSNQNELCVAGYHETDYLVIDLTNLYEVVRIEAGGWKRPFSGYSNIVHPMKGYVYGYASTNGFTSLCLFIKKMKERKQLLPSLITPSHGREINSIHWIDTYENKAWLVTGSEDRKVQIVEITKTKEQMTWNILHAFESHSSSVRAVDSIKYSQGYFLLTCGGRNSLCVWDLSDNKSTCHLLCSLPLRDSSNSIEGGDQRIMDTHIINITSSLFVFGTGDSSGRMTLYLINDTMKYPYCFVSTIVHPTPALSIKLCCLHNRYFAIIGSAAGDLIVIDFTEELMNAMEIMKTKKRDEIVSDYHNHHEIPALSEQKLTCIKNVHQMGINDLNVTVQGSILRCVTVGDDQTMHVTYLDCSENQIKCTDSVILKDVSGTSIRSLACVDNSVFITGWEQCVQKWNWNEKTLCYVDKLPVQVPETGCLDVIRSKQGILGCVCGAMGFEAFEVSI